MNEFLLIFRADDSPQQVLTPEQLRSISQPWQDWMGSLAAQNQLVNIGNRLSPDGKVVKANAIVTNGPFVELKEVIGGYTIIQAPSLQEAAEISKGCPILHIGGSVEIREIVPMNG